MAGLPCRWTILRAYLSDQQHRSERAGAFVGVRQLIAGRACGLAAADQGSSGR
jgi:hypothetical protein